MKRKTRTKNRNNNKKQQNREQTEAINFSTLQRSGRQAQRSAGQPQATELRSVEHKHIKGKV